MEESQYPPSKRQRPQGNPPARQQAGDVCPKCGRPHPGQACPLLTGGCLYCGKMGHFARECRKKAADDLRRNGGAPLLPRPPPQPQQQQLSYQAQQPQSSGQKKAPGRVYTATVEQLTKGELVQGTILIANQAAFVLFDCGATHSFISVKFAELLHVPVSSLDNALNVYNPIGKNTICATYMAALDVVLADRHLSGLHYPSRYDRI